MTDEGEAPGNVSDESKQDGTNSDSDSDPRYPKLGFSNAVIEYN